jgi:alkanesulfonate monooxygenase SsuD/methylene tetrahydromethanopterin reductase-like flavin-dependent oxidoreductase (luciferase family)
MRRGPRASAALVVQTYDPGVAIQIVGFAIRSTDDEVGRLVECAVRRFTGSPDATPAIQLGPLPITVQAETHSEAIAAAERCIAECADELGIAEPWELLVVLHP